MDIKLSEKTKENMVRAMAPVAGMPPKNTEPIIL